MRSKGRLSHGWRPPYVRGSARTAGRPTRKQHGVVCIDHAAQPAWISRGAVARAARTGHLHRVHRGVYAVRHTGLSPRGEVSRSGRASRARPDALLSHRSAAVALGASARWSLARRSRSRGPRQARAPIRPVRLPSRRPALDRGSRRRSSAVWSGASAHRRADDRCSAVAPRYARAARLRRHRGASIRGRSRSARRCRGLPRRRSDARRGLLALAGSDRFGRATR